MKVSRFKLPLFIFTIVWLLSVQNASGQRQSFVSQIDKPNAWVDSLMTKMTIKEKVGQVFMIRVYTDRDSAYQDSVSKIITDENIGGIIYFHGSPTRQALLTNQLQAVSKTPLLVAMDGEWGLGMRLDSVAPYPFQLTLGAIQDNRLIYEMGKAVAADFIRIGMQMNFAPDIDINNNPNNPVINYRSFGDNRQNVTLKGIAYMKGMQDAGLLTTVKHFPGHGDTDVDSHLNLPQLNFDKARLDSLEEYPFKEAIKAGASGVLIAHLNVPALDSTANLPSTLSSPIITTLLMHQLGFKGLIVSDAMNMKGVVKFFPDGEADLKAFIAGNDILELSENSKRAADMITTAVQQSPALQAELDFKVRKILMAKSFTGLNHLTAVSTANLTSDLNKPSNQQLKQVLSDHSLTLLKGKQALKSLKPGLKTLIIHIGTKTATIFDQDLKVGFKNSTSIYLDNTSTTAEIDSLLKSLPNFKQVIAGIYDPRARPKSTLELSPALFNLVSELASGNKTIISVFANPYTLATFKDIEKSRALLACYQMSDETQHAAAQILEGKLKPSGRLPVNINGYFPYGSGQ
jgi:beta-glucosidase-like glycosyl hydrolase